MEADKTVTHSSLDLQPLSKSYYAVLHFWHKRRVQKTIGD